MDFPKLPEVWLRCEDRGLGICCGAHGGGLCELAIYRNISVTLDNELDFLVIARSGGSFDELSRLQQEGLYRYTLQAPVEVQRGDLLGVSYSNLPIRGQQMQLLFRDVSSESEGVLSYRRKLIARSVFNANNELIVQSDSQHLPLVTPILGKLAN